MSSESDEELGESAKGKKKTSEKKESSDSEETTTKNKKKNSKMKDSDSDDDKEKSHKKKKKHTKKDQESSDSDDDIEETTKKKKKPPQHKKRPRKLPEFSDKVVPRIVLLGATGAGKSHLGNTLLGEKRFIVSDNPESCTSEASEIVRGFWLGDGPEFEIIDTPGLNDSEGRDTEHIQNIVENLRDNKFVNMFLIVRNGHDLRMANSYSDMLRMFEMIFGDTFWKHAMFDVSGNLGKAKKSAARKWIRALRDSFPNARTVKSVFLDVEEEDEDFNSNVDKLWQSCSTFPKFACKDIKVVLAEKDRLEAEKEQLAAENEENAKKLKALKKAKSQEQEEYEEKLREAKIQADKAIEEERKLAEREKREELQKLLDQVKEKESELHQINADKISVVMERDFDLKLHKQENLAKEHFEKEKKDLRIHYENLLEEKIREERENEIKKSQNEQGLLDQIRELKKLNEVSGLFANEKMRYDAEKEKMLKAQQKEIEKRDQEHQKEIEERDKLIQSLKDDITAGKEFKIKEENNRKQKMEKEQKEELVQQVKNHEEEKHIEVQNFQSQYPALLSSKDLTPAQSLFKEAKQDGSRKRFQTDVQIKLRKGDDIKNRKGEVAARFFETNHQEGFLQKLASQIGSKPKKGILKKTIMILGLTGSGKTTFIDALINYVYDTRYEDPYRLKLIRMTKEESAKNQDQAVSQTDHIVVYKVHCIPGMKINYQLTLVDTPGFGDTRGVDYDKMLMLNIEDLFKSKKITHLDAIGFVAKSGDARLTAQQNYIFESILHIFGKDVKDNLISILTNFDGQQINILDSFEKANMDFVQNFPINSAAIFMPPPEDQPDQSYLTRNPEIAQYQKFFDEAEKLTEAVSNMVPKSLDQTIGVLNDREKIQVELQGVQERVMELLLQKDKIEIETDICNQHAVNAEANKDTEYEVEEQNMKKEQLKPGTYVTNCLNCNRTCHYPCMIPNDEGKRGCAAMRGENCSVCPQKCHWKKHVNNPYRIVIETVKVKKTYDELIKRHADFLAKHKGQKTVVDALKSEADAASKEIQDSVPRISQCLESLKENALRPNMSSSADYLDQMISAEDHERKPGWQKRIKQLRMELDKAKMLNIVQDGGDIMNAKK